MAICTQKLSFSTIMRTKNSKKEKTSGNGPSVLPSMRSDFNAAFMSGTKRFELPIKRDLSGTLIQIHLVGHETLDQSYRLRREYMDSFSMCMLVKGRMNVIYDNFISNAEPFVLRLRDCRKPTVAWLDPPKNGESVCAEQYYIHFVPSPFVVNVYEYLMRFSINFQLGSDVLCFVPLVESIIAAMESGTFNEVEFSVKFYEFFVKLVEYVRSKGYDKTAVPDAVSKTLDFIAENYTRKISVEECARNVFLSPNYLNNLFCSCVKLPIAEYISKYRYNKATELLITSNMSVSEIADAVGLYDMQALIRLFKKQVGTTPLAYRRFYKGNR